MLNISTDEKGIKLKRKERQTESGEVWATYSTTLTKKTPSGGWSHSYLDVKFKKGVSLNDGAVIKFGIGDAWLTFDDFNGKKYNKIFVANFEIVEEGSPSATQRNEAINDAFLNIDDSSDLPFV